MRKQVADLLEQVITEFNDMYDQYSVETNEEAVLYGKGAVIDSIGLVALIVEVGFRFEEAFDVTVDLMNEKAFSQKNSPFTTVGRLIDYIVQVIEEKKNE